MIRWTVAFCVVGWLACAAHKALPYFRVLVGVYEKCLRLGHRKLYPARSTHRTSWIPLSDKKVTGVICIIQFFFSSSALWIKWRILSHCRWCLRCSPVSTIHLLIDDYISQQQKVMLFLLVKHCKDKLTQKTCVVFVWFHIFFFMCIVPRSLCSFRKHRLSFLALACISREAQMTHIYRES